MKTPPIIKSVAQVLAELQAKHPDLVPHVEQDRNWLWLVWDGRGEQNKAVRESLGRQGIGFQFAPQGHTLPSGLVAHWAHHCEHPTRFKRKGKNTSTDGQPSTSQQEVSDEMLLAALG